MQEIAAGADVGQALGVVLPGFDDQAEIGGHVGGVGLERTQPGRQLGQGGPAGQGTVGQTDLIERAGGAAPGGRRTAARVFGIERGQGGSGGLAVGRGLGQALLLPSERRVLVRIGEAGAVDLGELMA